MASAAITTAPAAARVERYRRAERALWNHYDVEPAEQFVDVDAPAVRLRVLEVRAGEPLLFVHGTAGAGPVWAPLVRELTGCRCLLLDRSGWGVLATSLIRAVTWRLRRHMARTQAG